MATEKKLPEINSAPTFIDSEKREWFIKLTLGSLDDVQEQTKVDLVPDGNDVSAITGLLFNHKKLGGVLWALCEAQAEKREINRKSFSNALDAGALAKGWKAVCDAIIFFIHAQNPKLGAAIERIIEAEMTVLEAGADEMLKAVESQEVDEALKATAKRIGQQMRDETVKQLGSFAIGSEES